MFGVARFRQSTFVVVGILGVAWGCGGGSSGGASNAATGGDSSAPLGTGGNSENGGEVGTGGADAVGSGGSQPDTSTTSTGTDCAPGNAGCPCYGNDTCNTGLACVASVCVGTGSGGAPATGGGGNNGGATNNATGGAPVPVGGAGVGGATTGVLPTGGALTVGGATSTAPKTGGTPGTGGVPSTGGATSTDPCAEPSLYCPCSTLGALNCLGHAQKVQLLCDGTRWIANGTCSSTLVCDTAPGTNQGLCTTPATQCVGRQSGESFCTGLTKYTCGLDLLNISSVTCPYVCSQGSCVGVCTPNTNGCLENQTATCDSLGHLVPVSTCVHGCVLGACCGAATPDACGNSCVDLQTNNSNCGTCGHACTGGKTCQAGACACPTNQTDCGGSCVNLQTNKLNCNACGNACPGSQSCSGGACGMFNLITNGDFSAGTTNWQLSTYSGATIAMSGDSLCLYMTSYGYGTLGWGGLTLSTPLAAGTSYTFSYTAVVTTGSLYTFTAKVGHAVASYNPDFTTSADLPSTTSQVFTHTWTQSLADTGAGIGFTVSANTSTATVCFQNVTLLAN